MLTVPSNDGDPWNRKWQGCCLPTLTDMLLDFTHDHARIRAYRWGEDGIAGVCDSHGYLNVAFSFWNGKESDNSDP